MAYKILTTGFMRFPKDLEHLIYDYTDYGCKKYVLGGCDNPNYETGHFYHDTSNWKYAARNPYVRQLRNCYENNPKIPGDINAISALYGYWKNILWLKKTGFAITLWTIEFAFINGDVRIIKRLLKLWNGPLYIDTLAARGDLKTIKFLKKMGQTYSEYAAFKFAIFRNDLKMMKWLKRNYNIESGRLFHAIGSCDLKTIKWLKNSGYEFDHSDFLVALVRKDRKIIDWLRENKHPDAIDPFHWAAYTGDLDEMKKLKKEKCEFGRYTFTCAAFNGNLDNMIWLRDIGCDFDRYTFSTILFKDDQKNLQYAIDNGYSYDNALWHHIGENSDNFEKYMLFDKHGKCYNPWIAYLSYGADGLIKYRNKMSYNMAYLRYAYVNHTMEEIRRLIDAFDMPLP